MPVPKLYDLHATINRRREAKASAQAELERAIEIARSSASKVNPALGQQQRKREALGTP